MKTEIRQMVTGKVLFEGEARVVYPFGDVIIEWIQVIGDCLTVTVREDVKVMLGEDGSLRINY